MIIVLNLHYLIIVHLGKSDQIGIEDPVILKSREGKAVDAKFYFDGMVTIREDGRYEEKYHNEQIEELRKQIRTKYLEYLLHPSKKNKRTGDTAIGKTDLTEYEYVRLAIRSQPFLFGDYRIRQK